MLLVEKVLQLGHHLGEVGCRRSGDDDLEVVPPRVTVDVYLA